MILIDDQIEYLFAQQDNSVFAKAVEKVCLSLF